MGEYNSGEVGATVCPPPYLSVFQAKGERRRSRNEQPPVSPAPVEHIRMSGGGIEIAFRLFGAVIEAEVVVRKRI